MATTFASNAPFIINGQVTVAQRQDPLRGQLRAAGVTLIGRGDRARVYLPASGQSILLRAVKIVTRPSGRIHRHLSRYLLGISEQGVRWEVFLGVVTTLGNTLFQIRTSLQHGLLRLATAALSAGLSCQQCVRTVCG